MKIPQGRSITVQKALHKAAKIGCEKKNERRLFNTTHDKDTIDSRANFIIKRVRNTDNIEKELKKLPGSFLLSCSVPDKRKPAKRAGVEESSQQPKRIRTYVAPSTQPVTIIQLGPGSGASNPTTAAVTQNLVYMGAASSHLALAGIGSDGFLQAFAEAHRSAAAVPPIGSGGGGGGGANVALNFNFVANGTIGAPALILESAENAMRKIHKKQKDVPVEQLLYTAVQTVAEKLAELKSGSSVAGTDAAAKEYQMQACNVLAALMKGTNPKVAEAFQIASQAPLAATEQR